MVCIVPGITRRSASFTGSGLSSTADSSDHVAAAAPIAQASVTMETIVAPGRFVSLRNRQSKLVHPVLLPRFREPEAKTSSLGVRSGTYGRSRVYYPPADPIFAPASCWNCAHAFADCCKSPTYVVAVVLSLGLGTSVTLAALSGVNALVFKSLPGITERRDLIRVERATGAPLASAEFQAIATERLQSFTIARRAGSFAAPGHAARGTGIAAGRVRVCGFLRHARHAASRRAPARRRRCERRGAARRAAEANRSGEGRSTPTPAPSAAR